MELHKGAMYPHYICPVCGADLSFTPLEHGDTQPEMSCHYCGLSFGLGDLIENQREGVYAKWRSRWIEYCKRWWARRRL
jgi:transcription elongation factor Elf1